MRMGQYRISSIKELVAGKGELVSFRVFGRPREFVLNLPEFGKEENERIGRQMGRLYNECGCGVGGFFMFLGLVSMVVWVLTSPGSLGWGMVGSGFLVVVGCAFVGKVIGIGMYRWRLSVLVDGVLEEAMARSRASDFES